MCCCLLQHGKNGQLYRLCWSHVVTSAALYLLLSQLHCPPVAASVLRPQSAAVIALDARSLTAAAAAAAAAAGGVVADIAADDVLLPAATALPKKQLKNRCKNQLQLVAFLFW
jgi:hypothetical protein